MTLTLTAADLIEPTGPLTTTLFPGDDAHALSTRAEAYIAAAAGDSRVAAIIAADASKADAATRAYALWRAYTAAWQRMSLEPITVNVQEKGSHGYSTAQLANIKALADGYVADLEAMVPAPTTESVPLGTTAVANQFTW